MTAKTFLPSTKMHLAPSAMRKWKGSAILPAQFAGNPSTPSAWKFGQDINSIMEIKSPAQCADQSSITPWEWLWLICKGGRRDLACTREQPAKHVVKKIFKDWSTSVCYAQALIYVSFAMKAISTSIMTNFSSRKWWMSLGGLLRSEWKNLENNFLNWSKKYKPEISQPILTL